jgi:putative ABC transport system permease protein
MSRVSVRELAPSILVSALSSAFGVAVLQLVGVLSQAIAADDVTGSSETVAMLLSLVGIVFIVIAVYVGAVVTANTFGTIVAGRTRTIALMRLIGSSSKAQRNGVAREGIFVGLVGGVIGAIAGTITSVAVVAIGLATEFLPAGVEFSFFSPILVFPVVTVFLTTWMASILGSRRVLTVSPMDAVGAANEHSHAENTASRGRTATAVTLFAIGTGILVVAVLAGLLTPMAVLVGVLGGLLSFTGLVLGAHVVMPPVLRTLGRVFGRSAASRLAAENALRYPERSSRTTIGLVIGITLVTMFAVALQSYQNIITASQQADPEYYRGVEESIAVTLVIVSILVGFSALIAAVGMVNNLSLSVLQRTRELGLLRALGFTARQIRSMIAAESAQLTLASVVVGLTLGTFYGWAGAQATFGSMTGSPGLVVPGIPLPFIAGLILLAACLTLGASLGPSVRATRISPVAALAHD